MELELKELEEELRGFSPSPVSADVLNRMVLAMDRWQDEERLDSSEDKVVAFPAEKRRSSWVPMWASAATVALLGAVIGLVFPNQNEAEIASFKGLGSVPVLRQASLVPTNFQRKVRSMDAGMVSNKDGTEYQLIRVVQQEEADFRGEDNVGLKITRPKVNYYVMPVSY